MPLEELVDPEPPLMEAELLEGALMAPVAPLEGAILPELIVLLLVSGVEEVLGVLLVVEGVVVVVDVSSFLPQAPRASSADRAMTVAAGLNDACMSLFPCVMDGLNASLGPI